MTDLSITKARAEILRNVDCYTSHMILQIAVVHGLTNLVHAISSDVSQDNSSDNWMEERKNDTIHELIFFKDTKLLHKDNFTTQQEIPNSNPN